MYGAGHLIEAAVANYEATGKTNLLQIARRYADYLDSVFGSAPGKRMGYPGHPELELALVKLWHATGQRRYFDLARFFIESRGHGFFAQEHHVPLARYDGTYWLDNRPLCDFTKIEGHAVRAGYLMSGATDVAGETRDPALLAMIQRVWGDLVERNLYLTGGIGSSARNEGFTHDYDLPNLTAYQETCASVAMAKWSHRLALLYADARYADVFERSLYNGVLAGVSLDGKRFFYVNPLESRGDHHRAPWFGCACCPPNAARTIASIGGYAYAVGDTGLWVNLYIQGTMEATLAGQPVRLAVTTDYPWDGHVLLETRLESPARFALHLRVPGWCRGATVSLNGVPVSDPATQRGYFVLSRRWRTGDRVTLELPMPVERVAANPRVAADRGLLAIQRGPLVYCLEACDQTAPLSSLFIPPKTQLEAEKRPGLLGGVVVVSGVGEVAQAADWSGRLYQPAPALRQVGFQAVPYCVWDNRAPGAMKVWMPASLPE